LPFALIVIFLRPSDKNSGYTPASPDALIFKGKTIYCVEFKNSFENHIKDKNIRNKAKNGYEVLSNIFTKLELKITDYELIFCVVHKGRKEEDIWSSLKYKQKKRSIQFDLEQYRGSLFADIFTNDIDFFKGQFIKKIDQNLSTILSKL
jgi:hypothetical protein